MISILKHRYSILSILNTDTMELRYQVNKFDTVDSCQHAEPFLGQMGSMGGQQVSKLLNILQVSAVSHSWYQNRKNRKYRYRISETASIAILSIRQYWPSTSFNHIHDITWSHHHLHRSLASIVFIIPANLLHLKYRRFGSYEVCKVIKPPSVTILSSAPI